MSSKQKNRLSLKLRILVVSLGACVIASLSGAVAWYQIRQVSNITLSLSEYALPAVSRVSDIGTSVAVFRQAQLSLLASHKDPKAAQDSKDAIDEASGEITIGMRTFEKLSHSSKIQGEYSQMKELWANYLSINDDFIASIEKGEIDQARTILMTEGLEVFTPLRENLGMANEFIFDEAIALKDESSAMTRNAVLLISILLPLALVIGAVLSLAMGRKIGNQVGGVASSLGSEFQVVASAADDITAMSTKMSHAAQQQEVALTEIVTAVDEINAMVNQNANNAKETNVLTMKSGEAATVGQQTAQAMLTAIEEIVRINQITMEKVEHSHGEMQEIVRVILELSDRTRVINDIAFQTKILSFNASVEAARAGDQGRGFAVVAEEVGNLAQMSGNAAREITLMLETSVSKVKSVTEGMRESVAATLEESRSKVDTGRTTAIACADSLNTIQSDIARVVSMVSEIARASQEQATGVSEVSKAMAHLNEITQQYVGVAQSSDVAAQTLSQQKQKFQYMVSELVAIVTGKIPSPTESSEEGRVETPSTAHKDHDVAA